MRKVVVLVLLAMLVLVGCGPSDLEMQVTLQAVEAWLAETEPEIVEVTREVLVEETVIVEVPVSETIIVEVEVTREVEVEVEVVVTATPIPSPTPEPPPTAVPTAVPPTAVPVPTTVPATAVPPPPTAVPVCDCSYDRYNCSDFGNRRAAEACYHYCLGQGKGDIHRLDGNDKDGKPCESLPK